MGPELLSAIQDDALHKARRARLAVAASTSLLTPPLLLLLGRHATLPSTALRRSAWTTRRSRTWRAPGTLRRACSSKSAAAQTVNGAPDALRAAAARQVSVAHLRPLHAPCTRGDGASVASRAASAVSASACASADALHAAPAARQAPAWSFGTDGALAAATNDALRLEDPAHPAALTVPEHGLDFERAWRLLPHTERAAYLRIIPTGSFAALFKARATLHTPTAAVTARSNGVDSS
jgi:hypothetical protein